MLYNNVLSTAQIKQIASQLPNGICDYSTLKNLGNIPQQNMFLLFSPIRVYNNIAQSLVKTTNGILSAHIRGNAGVVQLPTTTMKTKYLSPIQNLLLIMQTFKIYAVPQEQKEKILNKLLIASQPFLKNLNKYASGTVRAKKEYKTFAKIIGYHMEANSNILISSTTLKSLEDIMMINKILAKYVTINKNFQ